MEIIVRSDRLVLEVHRRAVPGLRYANDHRLFDRGPSHQSRPPPPGHGPSRQEDHLRRRR